MLRSGDDFTRATAWNEMRESRPAQLSKTKASYTRLVFCYGFTAQAKTAQKSCQCLHVVQFFRRYNPVKS